MESLLYVVYHKERFRCYSEIEKKVWGKLCHFIMYKVDNWEAFRSRELLKQYIWWET